MMIGHLAVPSLDDTAAPVRAQFENTYGTHRHEVPEEATLPATLSRRIIVGLLRGELGFDGLVVTDAMDMGGLAAHFDPGEAAVRGIEAGEDQILYSADTDAAIAAVHEAVQRGRLTERRIDESIARIEAAREFVSRQETGDRAVDHGLAEEIARRSIALVRDEAGLLPLRARNIAAVVVSDLPEENPLVDAVRELGLPGVLMADATTASLDIDADVILLLLALRPKSGAGRIAVPAAVRALSERHARKTIAVSFGSPYILRELGEVSTYVCAWGIQPVLQRAAIAALRGRFEMRGRVPVSI
jgi:beta-N-acetylhexosaminidase